MRQCILINDNWDFIHSDLPINELSNASSKQSVNLPHVYEFSKNQTSNEEKINGCWYVRKFSLEQLDTNQQLFLEINGAANQSISVYINGQTIFHPNTNTTTLCVDITEYLSIPNTEIALHISSKEIPIASDHSVDSNNFLGIWGDISIIIVQNTHFDLDYLGSQPFLVTPVLKGDTAHVRLITYIANALESQTVTYEIYTKEQTLLATTSCSALCPTSSITIDNPHLWQGQADPYLYSVVAKIIEDNNVVDSICTKFGIRTFYVDADLGFFLNGISYPLCYETKQTPYNQSFHTNNINTIKTMLLEQKSKGINYIRSNSETNVEAIYHLFDELGFIISTDVEFSSNFFDTLELKQEGLLFLRGLMLQTYNHPCVCFYGISNKIVLDEKNEIFLENLKQFHSTIHKLDPTRNTLLPNLFVNDIEFARIKYESFLTYHPTLGWIIKTPLTFSI